jgi:hypothetical protein
MSFASRSLVAAIVLVVVMVGSLQPESSEKPTFGS